jgi:hypothetical protein
MERWIGSCRREYLDNILIYNARHAGYVLAEYIDHHNTARPHRSLPQLAPCDNGEPGPGQSNAKIIRIDRLGGAITSTPSSAPAPDIFGTHKILQRD